ncbi:MAG: hypothetical protein DELT_02889 [Desulfovibrio sp.]
MHESLRLYDTALEILTRENEALEKEDDDLLATLYADRVSIMAEAWEQRTGCNKTALVEKLRAIQKAQQELTQKASMQKETLRLALQNSKKQSTRLAGYGRVVSNWETAFTMVKEG